MISNTMADQVIPSNHQGILRATSNTLVSLINQCTISIDGMITDILMIASVVSKAAPPCTCPDIDPSSRQACGKSPALKKTQVTSTRKKVNKAYKNPVGLMGTTAAATAFG